MSLGVLCQFGGGTCGRPEKNARQQNGQQQVILRSQLSEKISKDQRTGAVWLREGRQMLSEEGGQLRHGQDLLKSAICGDNDRDFGGGVNCIAGVEAQSI